MRGDSSFHLVRRRRGETVRGKDNCCCLVVTPNWKKRLITSTSVFQFPFYCSLYSQDVCQPRQTFHRFITFVSNKLKTNRNIFGKKHVRTRFFPFFFFFFFLKRSDNFKGKIEKFKGKRVENEISAIESENAPFHIFTLVTK